ncbi:hypothetical protein [Granulosicoccus antarcticus]|uniref:Uncharacterized protein n=1 Tax=Granulosicoccus antarcticus IMCC3135 TaxID=1192854 RepID=A0A2Z2NQN2_9GAMM|nr:hypothetical protein [Granulosicoccus antarcticus]ASJ71988.1 hypothetical protein IMCC3135_09455 [Granulosicoccus antarcticus IMCC3135]
MKFENLKLWLSLPLVLFQYRRDVNKRYPEERTSKRCRYCVASVCAVAIAIGFFLYKGGLPQAVISQLSVFAADAPESLSASAPTRNVLVESNP